MKGRFKLFTFISLLLAAASVHARSDSTFIVRCVIDTIPHATYFISYRQGDVWVRDTVSLDAERRLEYIGKITEPSIFNLNIGNFNPGLVGDQTVYSFWIAPGETVSFIGKSNWKVNTEPHGVIASGKIDRLEPSQLEETRKRHLANVREAIRLQEMHQAGALSNADRRHLGDSVTLDFINRSPDDFFGLYLIYNRLLGGAGYPFAEEAMTHLSDGLKNTPTGKLVSKRLAVHKMTGIGQILPGFEQRDTSGNPVSLSDFRGKYVLVDFWASWCGPCRKEHPHLVKAYADYKSSGFEILGISLDDSKKDWLKAIRDDGLTWPQLSDLLGRDNELAKRLFIQGSIPDNFLLDPNGVIIARGLRGTEVLTKLESVFGIMFCTDLFSQPAKGQNEQVLRFVRTAMSDRANRFFLSKHDSLESVNVVFNKRQLDVVINSIVNKE